MWYMYRIIFVFGGYLRGDYEEFLFFRLYIFEMLSMFYFYIKKRVLKFNNVIVKNWI